MTSHCVFSCSHPLWGSEGTCIENGDSDEQDLCACGPGYASRDSFGRPSCVPTKVDFEITMEYPDRMFKGPPHVQAALHSFCRRSRRASQKAKRKSAVQD